jgi:Phage P2 GpU
MIGLYGPIFFHSGSTGLTTFDEMRKTVSARWGDHPVHLQKPLLEYGGPQLIEISFRMELIKPFTMDPLGAIVILEEIMDLAIPLPLVIGLKPMGRGVSLFVLQQLSHEMKYFYRGGGLLGASVEVQLREYPDTFTISNLLRALGGQGGPAAPTGDVNVGPLTEVSSSDPNLVTNETSSPQTFLNPATGSYEPLQPVAGEQPMYLNPATGNYEPLADPTIAQNTATNTVANNVAPDPISEPASNATSDLNKQADDLTKLLESKGAVTIEE